MRNHCVLTCEFQVSWRDKYGVYVSRDLHLPGSTEISSGWTRTCPLNLRLQCRLSETRLRELLLKLIPTLNSLHCFITSTRPHHQICELDTRWFFSHTSSVLNFLTWAAGLLSGLKKAYGRERERKSEARGRAGAEAQAAHLSWRKGVKDWNSLGACGGLLLSYRYPVPAHIILADSFVFSFALLFFLIKMDDRMTGGERERAQSLPSWLLKILFIITVLDMFIRHRLNAGWTANS